MYYYTPGNENICYIKAFSGVFQYCWEKLSVPFCQQDIQNIPSQEDKIGWFPSQQAEQRQFYTTYYFASQQDSSGEQIKSGTDSLCALSIGQ